MSSLRGEKKERIFMINKNVQKQSAVFENFHGMDTSAPFASGVCRRLENFRVRSDGSLEKREGYRNLATLPAIARAAYSYADGGEEVLLVVAGSYLCRIRKSDGALQTSSAFITSEGHAMFFEYKDALYIMDGERVYRYDGGATATEVDPYIPLMAKEWRADTKNPGTSTTELNLMSRLGLYIFVQADLYVEKTFRTLYFDRPIIGVERLLVGDSEYTEADFTYASDRKSIQMKNWTETNCEPIYAYVILAEEAPLLAAMRAFRFESILTSELFFYGTSNPSVLYLAEKSVDYTASQMPDKPSCPLYFKETAAYTFDGNRNIHTLMRVGGRMLAFSDHDICISKSELGLGSQLNFVTLCDVVGCAGEGVLLLDDTELLTVDTGGIYRVTFDPSLKEDCRLKLLSSPICEALGARFYSGTRLCFMRTEREIWFTDPSGRGEVFVYRLDEGVWYVFSGIRADILLDFFGDIAFADGVFVNVFDREAKADHAAYGTLAIHGKLETAYFDFGAPEKDKRLSGFLAVADLDGGELEVRVSDGGYLAEFSLSGDSLVLESDLRSGRFRYATLRLTATGEARQRIWRAKVFI